MKSFKKHPKIKKKKKKSRAYILAKDLPPEN